MTSLPKIAPAQGHEDRSAEILERIRHAFAEKGFDGASMQDLARAAGMSAGNFYRYFPSKLAIVEALIALDSAQVEASFAAIRSAPDLRAAMRRTFAQRLHEDRQIKGLLWAEISAAALRKSEIAPSCSRIEDVVAGQITGVFAALTGLPVADCTARFAAHARFLILLVKSSAMRGPEADDPALDALIMASFDRTLDDVVALAAKG